MPSPAKYVEIIFCVCGSGKKTNPFKLLNQIAKYLNSLFRQACLLRNQVAYFAGNSGTFLQHGPNLPRSQVGFIYGKEEVCLNEIQAYYTPDIDQLYDESGRLFHQTDALQFTRIDLTNFHSGIYLLKLVNDNKFMVQKVIKKLANYCIWFKQKPGILFI